MVADGITIAKGFDKLRHISVALLWSPEIDHQMVCRAQAGFASSSYLPNRSNRLGQIWTPFCLVRELGDEQRKWLGITGDPQGARVRRIETHVADQFSGYPFAARIIPQYTRLVCDGPRRRRKAPRSAQC